MKKQLFKLATMLLVASLFSVSCDNDPGKNQEPATAEMTETEASTPKKIGLQVGETAPDFALQNVDGRMISLRDFVDAKGFIVIFTCNTCPYSVAYEDRIIALHEKFAPRGYPVFAVQPNDPAIKKGDSFENMQKRAAEKQFSFPYLMDDGSVTPVYGATRTPEIYLLDKALTLRYTGAIDDNAQDPDAVQLRYVEKAVEALEAGRQPEPSLVKAIGCTIQPRKPKES